MIALIRQLVMIILDYLFSKEMTTYQWYQFQIIVDQSTQIFSRGRGHATLHLVVSVGKLVRSKYFLILSGFCIVAPAQPSATVLPCIQSIYISASIMGHNYYISNRNVGKLVWFINCIKFLIKWRKLRHSSLIIQQRISIQRMMTMMYITYVYACITKNFTGRKRLRHLYAWFWHE